VTRFQKQRAEQPCDSCGRAVKVDGVDPENPLEIYSHCGSCDEAFHTGPNGDRAMIGQPLAKSDPVIARAQAAAQELRLAVRKSREARGESGPENDGDALASLAKAFDVSAGGAAEMIAAPQLNEAVMAAARQRYRDRGSPAPAARWLPQIYNEILNEPRDPFLPAHSQTNPTWGQTINMAAPTEKGLVEQRGLVEKRDAADAAIEALVVDIQRKHADWSPLKARDAAMRSAAYQKLYGVRLAADRQLRKLESGE
jgi:hypothetical protein